MKQTTTLGLCALGLLALAVATPANAISTLKGDYFKIPNGHPDTVNGIDGGTLQGLVTSTLGPDGLPVASPFGLTHSGGSGPISDVNGSNEILWWSTSSPFGVQYEKTQIDSLPLNDPFNFFPDGQNSNDPFYRAVHWSGSFVAPNSGTIHMTLSADDDAFAYIDGNLVLDNGGIKAINLSQNLDTISGLSAGSHTLDLFFADRFHVQSGILFSADVDFAPSAVPEPGTLSLLAGLGLTGAGFLRRRVRKSWK